MVKFSSSGRNYGYAKFTSKESANKAIETLHAQEICGNRLKVKILKLVVDIVIYCIIT